MIEEDLALLLRCPSCGAEPGVWCFTYRPRTLPPGQTATWLHTTRTAPVRAFWQRSYSEAVTFGIRFALRSPEKAGPYADKLETELWGQ